MIRTMKQTTKTMSNLSLDIEIVNPIESKSLFGGCDYCNNGYSQATGWRCMMNYGGSQSEGDGYGSDIASNIGYYDSNNHTLNGGYASDWNNYGGDNGGGGSDSGNTYDNSWVDNNGDGINDGDQLIPVILPNLPASVAIQAQPGSCVPTNASFLASYFGSPQSPEFMMHEFGLTQNWNANQEEYYLYDGLGVDLQVAFLLQQFNMTGVNTIVEMTNAIDNGHPVMAATIDANGSDGHQVTIVGYDSATTIFTAYDSVTGTYAEYLYSEISLAILSWEITGVKP